MAATNAYIDQYRKNSVNSASPLQLIVMLYDGALRFMNGAKVAMEARDLYKQNDQVQRAQKIVAELMSSLDMEKGGEIAQNLLSLYSFVYNRLVEANIEDRPELIEDAMLVMTQLRESWAVLEENSRSKSGLGVQDAA